MKSTITRYSRQRELVFNTVEELHDHPTAEEIYSKAIVDCPNLSLGTVYRNLNYLVECGRVRRVSVPGKADRFDPILKAHSHLYCTECGKVIDAMVDDAVLLKILHGIPGKVDGYSLTLFGVCDKCCQKQKQNQHEE
jgi:Fur family peroxide stress response transcriptional regulator